MQTADVKPTQLLQQIYNGWFSNISQLPAVEGQTITDGVMTGSSFAEAPAIETGRPKFLQRLQSYGLLSQPDGT
jgi:hypothetical protein